MIEDQAGKTPAPMKMDTVIVQKVANGFQVFPGADGVLWNSGGARHTLSSIQVFPTWAETSKWIGDQFR